MLFRFNNYQQSVYFTSANAISGKVYEISGGIMSYFYLKSANETLLERNTILERQLTFLRNALKDRNVDSLEINRLAELSSNQYKTIPAHVINNSLNLVNNYLTLDKGKSDGILPEMGVIGEEGVVGIVYMASEHYSVVISVLNSKSNISCKIKNSDYFGYLKWEHGDSRYAYLKDLPRHAEFNLGDTIITSGYSTVFPEGVMVGTVDDMADSNDGLSYLLKVKLATNFGKISNVRVITDVQRIEQEELELKTKAQ
jgi:rod shape-determining protein MreC